MSNERDELARLVAKTHRALTPYEVTDAILDAGYRKAELAEYLIECENMEEDDRELFWTLDEAKSYGDDCCTIKERRVTAWAVFKEASA